MTTTDTIPIPTVIVPHAYHGALYMLGLAADEIGKESDRRCPNLERALAVFDDRRALFEDIGKQPDPGVVIDEARRGELLEALREDIAVTAGMLKTATEEGHLDVARRHGRDLSEVTAFVEMLSEPVAA